MNDWARFQIHTKIEHHAVLDELVVLTTNLAEPNIAPRADHSIEEKIKVAAFSRTSAISYMDNYNVNALV